MNKLPLHNPRCHANHMGLWAIVPADGRAILSAAQSGMLVARAHEDEDDTGAGAYTHGSIRIIPVEGLMMKGQSKYGGTSTVAVRREIALANRDETIKGIALMIDSPGGHVAGMEALVDAVEGSVKPVRSYISDLGGSAAYWMASAGQEISTHRMAAVGSIGTYAVLEDSSQNLAMQGIKLHTVSSGGVKGAGADGSVSPELLAEVQKRVDFLNSAFGAAVQKGRKLTDEELATVHNGQVFDGEEAVALKLVDVVESADSFINRFMADVSRTPNRTKAALAIAQRRV